MKVKLTPKGNFRMTLDSNQAKHLWMVLNDSRRIWRDGYTPAKFYDITACVEEVENTALDLWDHLDAALEEDHGN